MDKWWINVIAIVFIIILLPSCSMLYTKEQTISDNSQYREQIDNMMMAQTDRFTQLAEANIPKCKGAFEVIFGKSPDEIYLYDVLTITPSVAVIAKSNNIIFQYIEVIEWCAQVELDAFQLVYHPRYVIPLQYRFKLIYTQEDYNEIIRNSILRDGEN